MARVLNNLLLFLIRLALKIRVWGYWSLIYGYCALCTTAALLKLCWNIVLRPTTTFQWGIRETPPACLNDTSLGTHCYVRIKVRHADARAVSRPSWNSLCLSPSRVCSRVLPHLFRTPSFFRSLSLSLSFVFLNCLPPLPAASRRDKPDRAWFC